VQRHEKVWVTRRIDIADHWRAVHPATHPSGMGE
jgi:allantoinase